MNKKKLRKFKELLAVPTKTWQEDRLIQYLRDHFDEKGYDFFVDEVGNMYVTKGVADAYPLVVAHTDTVHDIVEMEIREEFLPNSAGEKKCALKAYDAQHGNPVGIGGDDKAGVFICLELLEQCDVLKVFLPVAEEGGCAGTEEAYDSFFEDVAYGIQFDSPGGTTLSMSLNGVPLFDEQGEFINKIMPSIVHYGYTDWAAHPYTDMMVLREKFYFESINLSSGYYDLHTRGEYVVIEEVEKAIEMGYEVIQTLGSTVYKSSSMEERMEQFYGGERCKLSDLFSYSSY